MSITSISRSTLAVLCFAFAAPTEAASQGPPAAVRVEPVRQERIAERRRVTGEVRSIHRAEVATREAGIVETVEVREGEHVEKGKVLARLDAEQLELQLAVLVAQRAPAEARVAVRKSELERTQLDQRTLEELVGRDAANPKELADAKTARAAAEARLRESEGELAVLAAQVDQLRTRIGDMVLTAPFAGTVIARRCEVGSWLGTGDAVCVLLATEALEVWLEVPQTLLGATRREGLTVSVQVDATGESLEVSGCRAVPEVDPRSRTFALVAPLEASPTLAAGMSVTAQIPMEESREQLTVSRDAILRNDAGTFVYVVLPGGEGQPPRAAPMMVEVLFQTRERAVVRGARLAPGTSVVVEGNERLFPMAPIQPAPAGKTPPADGHPADGSTGGEEPR